MSVDQQFLDMARDLAKSRFAVSKLDATAPPAAEATAPTATPMVPGLESYVSMARALTTKPKKNLPFMDMAEEFVGNRAEYLLRNYNRPSFYGQTDTYGQERIRAVGALGTPRVVLRAPFSESEVQGALYAIYRQIFGNTYVMESERPIIAESQLRNGELTVRGFVRNLVKSEVFKTRFFYKASQNRAIELSHKLLLGRAPYDQSEISSHLDLYESQGYEADMDSYLDSEEYLENFGEDTVPYFRGFKYQVGQSAPAFKRLLDLYDGYATSDTDRAQIGQVARLTESLSLPVKQAPAPKTDAERWQLDVQSAWLTPTYGKYSFYAHTVTHGQDRIRATAALEVPKIALRAPFSESELQSALNVIYRQIFGGTHVMESERPIFAESQLRNGELTVRGFIRSVVKTEAYKTRFFSTASQNRFIELNYKHLLGRAPYDQQEISHHVALYNSQGYDAEVDSYLDSDEYLTTFGEDTVPYYRGFEYQTGQSNAGFNRMRQLYDGYAGSDTDRRRNGQVARLTDDLARSARQKSAPLVAPSAYQAPTAYQPTTQLSWSATPQPSAYGHTVTNGQDRIRATAALEVPKIVLRAPFSESELQSALNVIYRQIFGGTHVMESERPIFAESQLRDGKTTVRGFIRSVVKTEAYKTRFFSTASQNRFIELNYKHLLGRAPYNQQEISHHVALYNSQGYDAEVDSYLDSDEYLTTFGEDGVPYYRGFESQTGQQSTAAFNRMVSLYDGYAGSDTDRARSGQVARLTKSLARSVTQPSGQVVTNGQDRIRATAALEVPKIVLRAPFSESELQSALNVIYRQIFGGTHVMESERPIFAESQLRDGKTTVRGFIRSVVKTEAYKTRFFSTASQNRFIELNYKHLLGRAPYNQQEISHHVALYNAQGYDAEVDSYLDSDEYLTTFGEDGVPYYRGFESQTGQQSTDAFNRMVSLYDGYAGSDTDRARSGQVARLTEGLARSAQSKTAPVAFTPQPPTSPTYYQPPNTYQAPTFYQPTTYYQPPTSYQTTTQPSGSAAPESSPYGQVVTHGQDRIRATAALEVRKVVLRAPFSEGEMQSALNVIYRQVFGGTHVMESERPIFAESQLRDGKITVRDFIRYLVKTEAYKTRFFSRASQNRFIELNYKHLLGRAPYNQQEISHHVALYNTQGYDAEMDSYLDSDEYLTTFGEDTVPYYRGFESQTGQQSTDAFNRMIRLYDGYAGSDTDRGNAGQVARLTTNLAQAGR